MTKFVMNKNVMKELLKQKRQEKSLKTRELAQYLGIDQALISKFESGDRLPTRSQVMRLSEILEWPIEELLPIWLKQKIIAEVGRDEYAEKALQLVQEDIFEYRKRKEIGMSSRLIETIHEIEVLKNELNELRAYDSYRISQALELEYTFESNRIEGNTLSLKETDLIINEGITISGKSMREHLEAINHNEAIDYVNRPEPSNALQQGSMRQLSPANFDLTLPSVQWSNWIWGETARKKRKVEQVKEDHIRKINMPVLQISQT
jgi:transcriptional regulator with XRE-family HTH domain